MDILNREVNFINFSSRTKVCKSRIYFSGDFKNFEGKIFELEILFLSKFQKFELESSCLLKNRKYEIEKSKTIKSLKI